jgi:alkylhydroperoxidase family enzyme
MAWIPMVPEEEAGGRLGELYEQTRDPTWNRVDHIMAVHSLHPEGLHAHDVLYREAMKSTPTLRKVEREIMALVVSTINACHY